MSTHDKSYHWIVCNWCGEKVWRRTDTKQEYCSQSCSKLGENNPNFGDVKFTGTITEYKKFHARVYRLRGKATKCINGCIAIRYHWANISGKFEDPNDYQEMCPTCHSKYDRGSSGEVRMHG